MSRNYSDTIELTLMCSDEKKLFTDKRKSDAWVRLHEKRCKACTNATTTKTEFTIDYKINSATDMIRNQQIYAETTKKMNAMIND